VGARGFVAPPMAKKPKRVSRPAARSRRPIAARGRTARLPARQSLDLQHCEQLLLQEARLLDDGKFDDWLALFTPDAWYWVPSEPDQDNPHDTVSLIYDDRRLLETRVRRLASPRIYSQEPRSRTSRIVSNVSIEDSGNNACTVRSKFLMIEYRRDSQRLFAGTAFHRLVQADGGILIASKRVNLVNCDAPLDGIVVPF
jgi:3-phenylpropionate/cinnamic acid dioxygenase small subunit